LFLKLKNKKRVLKSFWKKGVGFGAGEKDLFTKRAFPPSQFPMPLLPDKLLFGGWSKKRGIFFIQLLKNLF
jgi:hypothetical protein